uniref:Uncharacterized protein n=1 Tax=Rhizophagus irregularis (strain DAOM 181602 / DAOM 197198 / MUCL 43194) TaxID=747089 RepID=U9TI18_RHIID
MHNGKIGKIDCVNVDQDRRARIEDNHTAICNEKIFVNTALASFSAFFNLSFL